MADNAMIPADWLWWQQMQQKQNQGQQPVNQIAYRQPLSKAPLPPPRPQNWGQMPGPQNFGQMPGIPSTVGGAGGATQQMPPPTDPSWLKTPYYDPMTGKPQYAPEGMKPEVWYHILHNPSYTEGQSQGLSPMQIQGFSPYQEVKPDPQMNDLHRLFRGQGQIQNFGNYLNGWPGWSM